MRWHPVLAVGVLIVAGNPGWAQDEPRAVTIMGIDPRSGQIVPNLNFGLYTLLGGSPVGTHRSISSPILLGRYEELDFFNRD